ncbi:MAG: tRNA preQ1(34) S-adenosylmethionine ribosyltransferase-isomerase QueA [Steroidobacteraceae bacterium]
MRRADFQFILPPELIAQEPLPARSASRMLVVERAICALADRSILDLPQLLQSGDLLIFNDTRVIPARLYGTKDSGGRVELLLERDLPGSRALVQARASKPLRPGNVVYVAGCALHVLAREGDLWELQFPQPALEFCERLGEVPLPPYITRGIAEQDRERYQSVLARVPGAVAAPTASLHFDAALLALLAQRGVAHTCVTLHVGAGTFQPLRVDDLARHVMHAERYVVPQNTVAAVARTRAAGGRIVAIGTTAARALESSVDAHGALIAGSGDTRLFITPGYRFRNVDLLLTNFHLPESTLLMLVAAFAGHECIQRAYAHAVRERYRFFSYGDAMLLGFDGNPHGAI